MNLDQLQIAIWKNWKKITLWSVWVLILLFFISYFIILLFGDDKRFFLPGNTTLGHHLFEEKCELCHTSFAGISNQKCLKCHNKDWQQKNVHPVRLWENEKQQPLQHIDASQCVTCHKEHLESKKRSRDSIDTEFCNACHEDMIKQKSHLNFAINQCLSCHHYHDDHWMTSEFLRIEKITLETDEQAEIPPSNFLQHYKKTTLNSIYPLTFEKRDAPEESHYNLATDWKKSSHANIGVNCKACHQRKDKWLEKPPDDYCIDCHAMEIKSFQKGLHGLRDALKLSKLDTRMADLTINPLLIEHKSLNCNSCHEAHQYDTKAAHVEKCLNCHNDEHSQAYKQAPHYQLWLQHKNDAKSLGKGVSCATCHMPIIKLKARFTNHDISDNLRPLRAMLPVCLQCHNNQFSLDSLIDETLRLNNFNGKPERQHNYLDVINH